jgi:hypothetical protein
MWAGCPGQRRSAPLPRRLLPRRLCAAALGAVRRPLAAAPPRSLTAVRLGLSLRNADAQTRVATYLNDHLGGSIGGVELARRARASNDGNQYGELLSWLVPQIEQDIEALRDIMRRLGVREDRLKQAAGWTGEKVGRLKPNGQLLGYSPLSRLVELETLMLGVSGKLALWASLESAYATDPRLGGVDLRRLAERAREQRRRLESMRRKAAVAALE